jgi:hypothetical protein
MRYLATSFLCRGIDIFSLSRGGGTSTRVESLLDIDGNACESFDNHQVGLGTAFKELNVVLVSQSLALFCGDSLVVTHISFVANQNLINTGSGVLLYVPNPVVDILETEFVTDIINQKDAHRATVIGGGDGSETFLSGGVPDLQLDSLAIQLNRLDLEINTDSGDERRCELIITESKQETTLADTRVANQKQLD